MAKLRSFEELEGLLEEKAGQSAEDWRAQDARRRLGEYGVLVKPADGDYRMLVDELMEHRELYGKHDPWQKFVEEVLRPAEDSVYDESRSDESHRVVHIEDTPEVSERWARRFDAMFKQSPHGSLRDVFRVAVVDPLLSGHYDAFRGEEEVDTEAHRNQFTGLTGSVAERLKGFGYVIPMDSDTTLEKVYRLGPGYMMRWHH